MERLHAALLLLWSLVASLLAPLFGRRRGLAEFHASYEKDRLPAVSDEERRALATFGGCIACGLCDAGQGARAVASGGAFKGVMDLVLASSRSMPDYDAAARSFARVDEAELARLEGICPARVPMRRLKQFVATKGAEVGART
jgi:hypothetical protein